VPQIGAYGDIRKFDQDCLVNREHFPSGPRDPPRFSDAFGPAVVI